MLISLFLMWLIVYQETGWFRVMLNIIFYFTLIFVIVKILEEIILRWLYIFFVLVSLLISQGATVKIQIWWAIHTSVSLSYQLTFDLLLVLLCFVFAILMYIFWFNIIHSILRVLYIMLAYCLRHILLHILCVFLIDLDILWAHIWQNNIIYIPM